jgi:hypothetical protein
MCGRVSGNIAKMLPMKGGELQSGASTSTTT